MRRTEYRLSDFGSYTAGGRLAVINGEPTRELNYTATTKYLHDPNGTIAIEHAYVQYFVPAGRSSLPPAVLVHGGGMAGSTWETTPDGRPGWLHGLLSAGIETHVVDNVERGRAGWCPLPGIWEGEPILRTLEEAWVRFRFGDINKTGVRRPFPGQQFPVDHFENFARTFVPRWTTTGELAVLGLVSVLKKTGPSILICHSQGAEAAFKAAARVPDRIKAIVALEPTGYGEPSALKSVPILLVTGDNIKKSTHWQNVVSRQRAFTKAFAAAGGQALELDLPEMGIHGNSHMLMADANSHEVLELVIQNLGICLNVTP